MVIEEKKMVVFNDKKIRRIWDEIKGEWFFSVVDVVGVLSDSLNPRNYWNMMKARELENGIQLYTICVQLKMQALDGKMRETDAADTKGILRIIQSIPSKKAESFKIWLAKVGSERIEEIENPELAQERMKSFYEQKGYPKDWIDKRIRGIAIRQNLTDEWKLRNIEEGKEYAILTNEISKAVFGLTVQEYKEHKNLEGQNLRDHMGDWELILTMISEKATTDITQNDNSLGLSECKDSAAKGGEIAGNTRRELEKSLGKSLVTEDNYLENKNLEVKDE